MSFAAILAQRVRALDAGDSDVFLGSDLDPDAAQFVRVLSVVTAGSELAAIQSPIPPGHADEIVGTCSLLKRMAARIPEVAVGPCDLASQYWISIARDARRDASTGCGLCREFFVPPDSNGSVPRTKPFGVGLFTSTALGGTAGMWWCYLRMHDGSRLFPRPWGLWRVHVDPNAAVFEIRNATDWVDFVTAFPVRNGDYLYPEWTKAADRWDAVHMTAHAIAATQGVTFASGRGVVAPPYWDVESTLWLRWAFGSPTSETA